MAQESIELWDLDRLNKELSEPETPRLLNFWATWCKPCIEELPLLKQASEDYDNLEVIFVSLDFADALESRVIPFVEDNLADQKVVLLDAGNPNVWIDLVDPEWSGAIPASTLITSESNYFFEGKFNEETITKFLKPVH